MNIYLIYSKGYSFLFSIRLFPVYIYDNAYSELKDITIYFFYLLIGIIIITFWGVISSLYFDDSYIGIGISSDSLLVIFILLFAFSYYSVHNIWKDMEIFGREYEHNDDNEEKEEKIDGLLLNVYFKYLFILIL